MHEADRDRPSAEWTAVELTEINCKTTLLVQVLCSRLGISPPQARLSTAARDSVTYAPAAPSPAQAPVWSYLRPLFQSNRPRTPNKSSSNHLTHLVKIEHKLYDGAMDTWTKRTLLLALGVRSATVGKEGSLMGCLHVAHYSVRRSFRVPTPPQPIETS